MKLTHEKFASYMFTAGIALVIIMGTALQMYIAPVYWMTILTRRLVSIGVVAAGYCICYRIKPALRLILLLNDVKMLVLLLAMVLLAVGRYWYNPVLFPVGAVFVLFSMIYTFRNDRVEFAFVGIVSFAVFFATEALDNCNPASAISILVGGTMAIVTAYDVKWYYLESFRIKTKQVIALFLLAATAVVFGVLPELGQIVGNALVNGVEGFVAPSLLEMTYLCFGKIVFWVLIMSLSVILVYGWDLVLLNRSTKHHYAVAAMTLLTVWIVGDVLKIYGIDVGLTTIGLGMENALEISLWLMCATILPLDHLFPNGWQYCYDPADFDFEAFEVPEDFNFEEFEDTDDYEKKSEDHAEAMARADAIAEFVILYTTLTDYERDITPEEELEMWEKIWFYHNERITDTNEKKLFEHFQKFCEKSEVMKH